MAQPFDKQYSSQYSGSAMSSQISPAANRGWAMASDKQYPTSRIYDDDGNIWKYKNVKKSGLAKIRSHGALAAARAAGQERSHRRGNSASASQSPISSTSGVNPDFGPYEIRSPPSAYSDYHPVSSPKAGIRTKVKIRPLLLRKLSSNDESAIDLSRSAAENEGLSIYNPIEVGGEGRTSGDAVVTRRGYHHRSNSQISTNTTSSTHRYGTQYIHPMRQTPRPYTPPVATFFQPSLNTEVQPTCAAINTPQSDSYIHQSPTISVGSSSYAPLPSTQRQPPPLRTSVLKFFFFAFVRQRHVNRVSGANDNTSVLESMMRCQHSL